MTRERAGAKEASTPQLGLDAGPISDGSRDPLICATGSGTSRESLLSIGLLCCSSTILLSTTSCLGNRLGRGEGGGVQGPATFSIFPEFPGGVSQIKQRSVERLRPSRYR